MSYCNLIDPIAHSKQRYFRRVNASNDDSDQGCIIEKLEDGDCKEKDDILNENMKPTYKKGNPLLDTSELNFNVYLQFISDQLKQCNSYIKFSYQV